MVEIILFVENSSWCWTFPNVRTTKIMGSEYSRFHFLKSYLLLVLYAFINF